MNASLDLLVHSELGAPLKYALYTQLVPRIARQKQLIFAVNHRQYPNTALIYFIAITTLQP